MIVAGDHDLQSPPLSGALSAAFRGFYPAYPGASHGAIRRAAPVASELLAAGPQVLRAMGLSQRKAATLEAVATRFADGALSDASLRRLSDDQIEERLTTIPGVGPWTVQGLLIIAFDRPDVVLPGDLALRKAIEAAYSMDHLPSQDEVLELAERWRPYRSLATAYLFAAAFAPPA